MGWSKPTRILDLFIEYRNHHNCLPTITGNNNLIGALIQYGLDTIGASEKQEMIDLILQGEPWSREEQTAILDYCESDVVPLDLVVSPVCRKTAFLGDPPKRRGIKSTNRIKPKLRK
jgi:DNA polymerase I